MNKLTTGATALILVSLLATAAEGSDKGVDYDKFHAQGIDKNAPIVVHAFDSSEADLGSFKHIDTATRVTEAAPHLLAVDVVETMREHGFTNVTLSDSAQPATEGLQLVGKFTEINPGSQATRVWIGFGAGASKVCVSGKLQTADGNVIGEFKDCEKGLGWGDSGTQTSGEASRMGANIGQMLNRWASSP